MDCFQAKLSAHSLTLRRGPLQTLQINVGRKCNQACTHCHADAGPWRTEMVDQPVARRIGEWILRHRPPDDVLALRDQANALDTRTAAEPWLGDPPPHRSALAPRAAVTADKPHESTQGIRTDLWKR